MTSVYLINCEMNKMRKLPIVLLNDLKSQMFKKRGKVVEVNVSPEDGNALSLSEAGLLVNTTNNNRKILGPFKGSYGHRINDHFGVHFQVVRPTGYDGDQPKIRFTVTDQYGNSGNYAAGFSVTLTSNYTSIRKNDNWGNLDPSIDVKYTDVISLSLYDPNDDTLISVYELGVSLIDGYMDTAVAWIEHIKTTNFIPYAAQ